MAALVAVSGAALATAGTAGAATSATSAATVSRIAGTDRYDTAAQLAEKAFPGGASNVIIASGAAAHFPDALSGNYLAGQLNAPILLTSSTGTTLPTATMNALSTLKPTNVYILGDANAVPTAQETALTTAGYTVKRLAGSDRYATNLAILQAAGAAGTVGGVTTAIVASGANFPDALSAGALAFADKLPIILTAPATLSAQASTAISSLGIKQVIIMGSTASVSAADETSIHSDGATTLQRFAGTDRSNTSQLLADWEIANVNFSAGGFIVATGDQTLNGADALAAGPYAGKSSMPVLVTNTINTPGSVTTFATNHSATESAVTILGTTNSVSAAAQTAITTAVQSQVGAVTKLPQLVSAAVTGTVTTAQANSTTPAGTTIKYTFSHNVLTATPGDFKVYNAADSAVAGTTAVGGTATVSGSVVTVLFPTIVNTTGGGATDASQLSLATVVPGAVTDAGGLVNPDGAASIGTTSSSTTTATANTTAAPDLRAVAGFREANPAVTANSTAVDFTFDQAATTTSAAGAGFDIVTTTGTDIACTGPVAGDTTFTGGGTVAGGNGTTKITAICPDVTAGTVISASTIARGYVAAGAVKGTDTTAATNPLQSASVSGGSTGADLTSAAFVPAGTGANTTSSDEVVFTFDQAVTGAPAAAGFQVFRSDASTVAGTSIPQTNSANTQFVVAFPAGTLTNAVGVNVSTAAGTNVQPASVGVTPVSTSTTSVTPGKTSAPQLTAVKVVKSTDVLGNTAYTAEYVFSYAVSGPVAANFHLYNASGVEYTAATCTVDSTTDTQVDCTGSTFTNLASSTNGNINDAVLGTADNAAVTGNTTSGVANIAPNTNPNPEGAANATAA